MSDIGELGRLSFPFRPSMSEYKGMRSRGMRSFAPLRDRSQHH